MNMPRKLRSGPVVPSSLGTRPTPAPFTGGGLYRAVVLQTYVRGDDAMSQDSALVECDVILVRSSIHLSHVPVMQAVGLHNTGPLWVPKGTDDTVSGEPFDLRPSEGSDLTSFDDFKGDLVLVEFLENDPDYPIITGQLPHELTKREEVVRGAGWSEGTLSLTRGTPQTDELYFRHQGMEFRTNASGDLLIDTEGAHVGDDETPVPLAGGEVRINLKPGVKFTIAAGGSDIFEVYEQAGQLRVDIGEGATESMVLGDRLNTWLGAHTHPDGFGGTLPPVQVATLLAHLSATKKVD